jgi:IMP and pyridine-specific 5'-nucleotidase
MSLGGNDFKARKACTTAWVANPGETVELLEELAGYMGWGQEKASGAVAD